MAELDSIVEDAIKYLQDGQATATDHEEQKPLAFNHIDSLLLAHKVRWVKLHIEARVLLHFALKILRSYLSKIPT